MPEKSTIHPPFETLAQQRSADLFGMYIFLASEIMLFGGLFAVMAVLRVLHSHDVVETSKELHYWIGGINTALLLSSSFLVALAVDMVKSRSKRSASLLLIGAAILGGGFLGLKAVEYMLEYREGALPVFTDLHAAPEPAARLFLDLYLVATALHALHVTIGIGLLICAAIWARKRNPIAVEIVGLYWHFVDIVWIFLYPLLYLAR